MGKTKPIYRCCHYAVHRCYSKELRKTFYTVVNLNTHVHRHTDDEKQALMMCKRAGLMRILPTDEEWFARNVKYLMTGLEKYK